MAHFARIDENNVVVQVLVVPNDQEHRGQEYLADDVGLGGRWIQTSYNTFAGVHSNGGVALHKNYAGIGFIFDGIGFHRPQPYPSWTLDLETYIWQAPIPFPNDGIMYQWDEENQVWFDPEKP